MTKASRRIARVALLLCTGIALSLCAGEAAKVTLHLKSGDRLTGEVLSEDDTRIVLSTSWNVAIFVPKSEIEQQVAITPVPEVKEPESDTTESAAVQPVPPAISQAPKPVSAEAKPVAVAKAKPLPAAPTKPKRPKRWKWNLKLGADLINGAKNREIYFGQTTLTYTHNYQANPKQFLRNKIEYRVDYGKTDGVESVNRMLGANRLDFDVGTGGFYGYAALGGGYDKIRKIEYQVELGPGLGYHLLATKTAALDAELGFNYQYREGLGNAPNREVVQARIGQELTWQVVPKITLTEQAAFLPFFDDLGEYQVRLRGNVGFGIVRHLSLNLTVLNFYDTLPAPGVPNNEFQFRSSVGINF